MPFGDDRELVMDILKYGPDCRVVEPAALRERVAKRARETAGIYMPMRPGGPGTGTRIG